MTDGYSTGSRFHLDISLDTLNQYLFIPSVPHIIPYIKFPARNSSSLKLLLLCLKNGNDLSDFCIERRSGDVRSECREEFEGRSGRKAHRAVTGGISITVRLTAAHRLKSSGGV